MSTVTPPKAHIPIGSVVIGGATYEVKSTPEIVRFFESLVTRVGGVAGPSTPELSLSQFEDAGIEETKSLLFANVDELRSRPGADVHSLGNEDPSGEIASLREEIAALRGRLDALEQGIQL